MRRRVPPYLFHGVFAPPVSLDSLLRPDADRDDRFDIRDERPDPAELMEIQQAWAALNTFLTDLPPRDAEILRRVYWEGESQAEIGRHLGVSKTAVRKALLRIQNLARNTLAEHQDALLH